MSLVKLLLAAVACVCVDAEVYNTFYNPPNEDIVTFENPPNEDIVTVIKKLDARISRLENTTNILVKKIEMNDGCRYTFCKVYGISQPHLAHHLRVEGNESIGFPY